MSAFVSNFQPLDRYEAVSYVVEATHVSSKTEKDQDELQNCDSQSKNLKQPGRWGQKNCFQGIDLAVACCCPCVLLGHMKTLVSRESSWRLCCSQYRLGGQGCESCLKMSVVALLCWPLPVGISFTLMRQRRLLRSAYNEEISSSYGDGICEAASVCCLWPCVLQQHFNYLNGKHSDGVLLFEWETDPSVIKDKVKPPPKMATQRIVVFGPGSCGKTVFSRKLLQASNCYDTGKSNTLQVGYRPLSISPTSVEYLEVWDTPNNNITANERAMIISEADALALLYDVSDVHSFDNALQLYEDIDGDLLKRTKTIVVIGTKMDVVWKSKDIYNGLDSTMGPIKENIYHELFGVAEQSRRVDEWCHLKELRHIDVSSVGNFNILACLKLLVRPK
jgi:hypothetical protein